LHTQDFQKERVREILDSGKLIIGITHPTTETMSKIHLPRFVERGKLTHLTRAHLFSPIGLGDHRKPGTEKDIIMKIRHHLLYSCLYYYYRDYIALSHSNLTSYMYTFTPIELREGVLICRERILTAHSGRFGWGDNAIPKVHVFDGDGIEIEPNVQF